MQKLFTIPLPNKLAVRTNFSDVLQNAFLARSQAFKMLSGYPQGGHIVGRIQEFIKLGSVTELLESIHRLRDITRLAADALSVIPMGRMDKYQLDAGEVKRYVTASAADMGFGHLTADELDLATYAITSSESPDNAWILSVNTTSANRILKFHKLYQELRTNTDQTLDWSAGFPVPVGTSTRPFMNFYTYEDDKMQSIVKLPRFVNRYKDELMNISDPLKRDPARLDFATEVANVDKLYRLYYIHVVDHVFQLLMDVNIWTSFISPRKSVDPSQNMERAKSLRTFSAYLHSLLIFPHIAHIEMFKSVYDKVQTWLVTLPPIDPFVIKEYEDTVRKYDVFNARHYVNTALGLLDAEGDAVLGTSILGFPSEMTSVFNIDKAINAAETAVNALTTLTNITNLIELQEKYPFAVMNSQPVAQFPAVKDFVSALSLEDAMRRPLRSAQNAIVNLTVRFCSDDVMRRLTDLNLSVPMPISCGNNYSVAADGFTQADVTGGKVNYRPLTPPYSLTVERGIRREMLNKIFSAAAIKDRPWWLLHEDARKWFVEESDILFGSYGPAELYMGTETLNTTKLKADPELVRKLIVDMSKQSYEFAVLTMRNAYVKTKWATALSGFALLYTDVSEDKTGALQWKDDITLVAQNGYGLPFGMTYLALEQLQGPVKPDELIRLAKGLYLRLLTKLPLPTDTLSIHNEFSNGNVYYYFPGETNPNAAKEVKEWVAMPGLWNFALCKLPTTTKAPPALLDRKFAYANGTLFMQADSLFSFTKNYPGNKPIGLAASEVAWPYDKLVFHAKYRRFGAYGESAPPPISTDVEVPNAITTLIDKFETEEKAMQTGRPEAKLAKIQNNDIKASVTKLKDYDPSDGRKIKLGGPEKPSGGSSNVKGKGKEKPKWGKDKGKEMDKPEEDGELEAK